MFKNRLRLLVILSYFALLPSLLFAANNDMVDAFKHELDGQVKDILWCGALNEAILVLTDPGTLYRSRDRGQTWKKLQSLMGKTGASVLDQGQQVIEIDSSL
jgi:hypothetical protein